MTSLNQDTLPPKPGHTITFAMPASMSTRRVNRVIRDTTDAVIAANVRLVPPYEMLRHATANYDRREAHSPIRGQRRPAHYVHGFGTPYRDTLVARYTPSLAEVIVHYPPNMWGLDHPTTDDWLRTRVNIWDALLFKIGGPDGVGGTVLSLT